MPKKIKREYIQRLLRGAVVVEAAEIAMVALTFCAENSATQKILESCL
jgi:hypothetical protein